MRTANPVLTERVFLGARGGALGSTMTVEGAVQKTAILLGLLLLGSSWTWGMAMARVFQKSAVQQLRCWTKSVESIVRKNYPSEGL